MSKYKLIEHPFDVISVTDNSIIDLIKRFNKSSDYTEKYAIVLQLPKSLFNVCRFCGKIIINENSKIKHKDGNIQLTIPKVKCREINGVKYTLSCCSECLNKHFNNDKLPGLKYIYMKANKYGKFCYNIPDDLFKEICSNTTAVTLETLIKKWGIDIGKQKWEIYKHKQSISNSYEYKHKKYGWTEDDYNKYNKSRAITLNNLINKYGENIGNEKWNSYLEKQHITKSYEYMVDKFGKDAADNINKSKGITLDNFIKRYGEIEGAKRFDKVMQKMPNFYSKISQDCFNKIDKYLSKKYTTYYATKNTEYGVNLKTYYICLDYYIKEINLCIEFNGTHFHADPTVYNENDYPNPYDKTITAKEIWERDNKRYDDLLNIANIKTVVIWENEYNNSFDVENFIKTKLNIEL